MQLIRREGNIRRAQFTLAFIGDGNPPPPEDDSTRHRVSHTGARRRPRQRVNAFGHLAVGSMTSMGLRQLGKGAVSIRDRPDDEEWRIR